MRHMAAAITQRAAYGRAMRGGTASHRARQSRTVVGQRATMCPGPCVTMRVLSHVRWRRLTRRIACHRAWLRPDSRGIWHFKSALEELTNVPRTESPRQGDQNKSDHTINGGGAAARGGGAAAVRITSTDFTTSIIVMFMLKAVKSAQFVPSTVDSTSTDSYKGTVPQLKQLSFFLLSKIPADTSQKLNSKLLSIIAYGQNLALVLQVHRS
ncbi:hypothetical protein F511_09819 [Dorcoceras hygrometricum]|uniref:Uncharacterized protein n=1 Tax=Dorcoceras hygrometricum TaxID=472368 RepID=A0A2Z7AKF0_9LAMI|nr:hypothetical protein F511_09819 [Dorcoceras hygrometricum]